MPSLLSSFRHKMSKTGSFKSTKSASATTNPFANNNNYAVQQAPNINSKDESCNDNNDNQKKCEKNDSNIRPVSEAPPAYSASAPLNFSAAYGTNLAPVDRTASPAPSNSSRMSGRLAAISP